MIRHYYHVYADGLWREPVAEHVAALADITEPMTVTVGLVGAEQACDEVRAVLAEAGLEVASFVQEAVGWEQVTLQQLSADLTTGHSSPVLYAHTKGAHDPSPINIVWRRSMTRHVIGDWRTCLDALGEFDAAGCHWLTADRWPDLVQNPFFGGNFWWATADYLRKLPPLDCNNRWDAEKWVGLASPRVYDLLPGWPSLTLCALKAVA